MTERSVYELCQERQGKILQQIFMSEDFAFPSEETLFWAPSAPTAVLVQTDGYGSLSLRTSFAALS
jgi:predicted amino acid dehydrogenase